MSALTIDYYFSPPSPWTYLGHDRFAALAKQYGARINVLPVDLGGKVFPVSRWQNCHLENFPWNLYGV